LVKKKLEGPSRGPPDARCEAGERPEKKSLKPEKKFQSETTVGNVFRGEAVGPSGRLKRRGVGK